MKSNPPPFVQPDCTCGHIAGCHEVKGQGLDRKHGRCISGHGTKGTPCDCLAYVPETMQAGA